MCYVLLLYFLKFSDAFVRNFYVKSMNLMLNLYETVIYQIDVELIALDRQGGEEVYFLIFTFFKVFNVFCS